MCDSPRSPVEGFLDIGEQVLDGCVVAGFRGGDTYACCDFKVDFVNPQLQRDVVTQSAVSRDREAVSHNLVGVGWCQNRNGSGSIQIDLAVRLPCAHLHRPHQHDAIARPELVWFDGISAADQINAFPGLHIEADHNLAVCFNSQGGVATGGCGAASKVLTI